MHIEQVEICPLVWCDFWFQPQFLCELQNRWMDALCLCGCPREVWRRRCDGLVVFCCWHCLWFIWNSTGQWPNTPPDCVRAIWPRRRVMECCIRWPGLYNHPISTQLRWFGMSWTEWRKSSQQVLSICGNSFKTVGKAFQVKLRMPRVCKAVFKAKVGY